MSPKLGIDNLKVKLNMRKNLMKEFEAKWVANALEGKEIFVLKCFVVIKLEKLHMEKASEIIRVG